MSPRRLRMRVGAGALAAAAMVVCAGCDRLFDKGSKRDLEQGDRKVATGDFRGAISAYESALDGTASTAEAHFKLALIYDDKLRSPRDALHHLERYLELAPRGARASEARKMQAEAQQKLALAFTKGGPSASQEEAVHLRNDKLRTQLADLRAQKAAQSAAAAVNKTGDAVQKPIPPHARTHLVESGETMASLARKYYRNEARWKEIQAANFYPSNTTPKIKVGQTLVIP